jgi:glycosyltransferase involved in cell wall biosynthesis
MRNSSRDAPTILPPSRRAMKILLLQDFLRNGGTERQTVWLANALAASGHRSGLLTFRPGGALAGTVNAGVERVALQRFDLGLDWFAPGLSRALRRSLPDVVVCMGRMANCHGHSVQKTLAAARPATAVVATMRTGKPLPWLFRRSLRVVRHIVANSREARETLVRDYRIAADRVTVIPNALIFPPEEIVVRNAALRMEHGATGETTVMLCVAMFRPEKNQRELIEIVAGLPSGIDWQLWLAGEGPARAACERLVARRHLGHRVKFLGFRPDPSALYGAADIAVHASWSEALSNFLIEAQAHGLPVVACEAQGIRECFVPDETGWAIPRGDHDRFRAALLRLIGEPAPVRAGRSATARRAARLAFDPGRQFAAYLELFARLQRSNSSSGNP